MNAYAAQMTGEGVGGAGKGAAAGSILGPIGTGIGAVVGGIGGLLFGRAKAARARREAETNAKLARIDTEFSPSVYGLGHGTHTVNPTPEQDSTGSALSGALAGGLQGYNIYKGIQQQNAEKDKLDFLKSLSGKSANPAQTAALVLGK